MLQAHSQRVLELRPSGKENSGPRSLRGIAGLLDGNGGLRSVLGVGDDTPPVLPLLSRRQRQGSTALACPGPPWHHEAVTETLPGPGIARRAGNALRRWR